MPQRADSKSRRRVEKISGLFRLFLNKRLAPGVIAKPARAPMCCGSLWRDLDSGRIKGRSPGCAGASRREETRGRLFGAFPIGAALDHEGQTEPLDFAC